MFVEQLVVLSFYQIQFLKQINYDTKRKSGRFIKKNVI
jgi:hypothetical protein